MDSDTLQSVPRTLTKRDNILRITGIALNIVWAILLIPGTLVCLSASLATVMLTDSGEANAVQFGAIMLSLCMFLITPIIIVASVIASFVLRKTNMYAVSVIVQATPLLVPLLAFGILCVFVFRSF